MNIMKKLFIASPQTTTSSSGSSSSSSSTSNPRDPNVQITPTTTNQSSQSISLACMHLRKLYGEYTHSLDNALLYNMLPIFCKLFNNLSYQELEDRFPETLHFSSSISRLLVLELRTRANTSPTSEAAKTIISYLYDQNEESHGYTLLSTINLLCCTVEPIIEIMCENNVPSTLVKCLYLFFDLPGCESNETGYRESVQKTFVQVLIRVCSYSIVSEELAKHDDLALLFSCVSSWCSEDNRSWRKCAGDVLMSVSTHGLSPPVLAYIHNKACVCLCVDNLRRGGVQSQTADTPGHLTPVEITEIVFTLFCFLKDSAVLSQVLLDDFKSTQGYTFLQDLVMQLEDSISTPNHTESLQNVMILITSLTTIGYNVLKPNPQNTSTPFSLPNFEIPSPGSKCSSIRNLHAFGILINVFNKSTTNFVCNLVLDSIDRVFRADHQNYFIVDSFLPQMAEKLCTKSVETQIKYLSLIEFLVFELNFTPCKELIALSRVLKSESTSHTHVMFKLLVIKSLLKILKHSGVFKDAYREIGLLEVSFTCIRDIETRGDQNPQTTHLNTETQTSVLELISTLISGNNSNLTLFRETSTIVSLLKSLNHDITRPFVFGILSVCFTSQGGEEEFTHALVCLQSIETRIVTEMLGLFCNSFRESHRARCNFRKAGGFLYLMSLIVSMEGAFACQSEELVSNMRVFQLVFMCFGLSMRFEPANAVLFKDHICLPSLADTIRLLSHFTNTSELTNAYPLSLLECINPESRVNEFHEIFSCNDLTSISQYTPLHVSLTLFTYRVLYDLALDNYDNNKNSRTISLNNSPSTVVKKTLNLNAVQDPVIVHSGIVIIMIRLLPSIKREYSDIDSCLCQLYCAELVKSLVRSERNQQIMAGVGVCTEIITRLGEAICDERTVIHNPIQYVFERVGTQALTPGELRKFLRLGNPLNCNKQVFSTHDAQVAAASTPVPLSRVKTLVSMTTPRSNNSTYTEHPTTPFCEFDMSAEGFGCLFIPSLGSAAVNYSQDFVVQSANLLSSGIGSSSSSTLGYSSWFCVDKFSDPKHDPHPVRLLSLIKESSNGVQRLCLSVLVSARDKALIISTKESGLPPPGIGDWEPDIPSNASTHTTRVWCPDIHESVWTHLIVYFHSNSVHVFVNGRNIQTTRLEPPQRSKHSNACNYAAFIGTPPMWRKSSKTCWKQGVAFLFEDFNISNNIAYCVYKLGPGYLGSFQSVRVGGDIHTHTINSNAEITTIIPEEKLLLGLNGIAVSLLTLQKIRKLYNKQDAKAIARQLGLSSHENATPITMLHNSCAHLMGPQPRPIGGICIGYLGVRVFSPQPVYKSVFSIGGIRILISLIALANTSESLYASLKALVCVVKNSNVRIDRPQAQVIGFVLKSKKSLLSMRVLHLVFSLVDGECGFAELLGDLDIWVTDESSINDLEKALYEHFINLLNEDKRAGEYFVRSGVLNNLLCRVNSHTHNSLFAVISVLIRNELVLFGWFIVDTLSERHVVEKTMTKKIEIRNKCLNVLHTCLYVGKNLNIQFCDDLIHTLGFDFVLLFIEPNVHEHTVVWGARILMLLLNSSNTNKNKFRDGSSSAFCFKTIGNLQTRVLANEYACLGLKHEDQKEWKTKEPKHTGGWVRLSWILSARVLEHDFEDIPVEVWLLICALVLSQGVRSTTVNTTTQDRVLTLDLIWNYVFPGTQIQTSASLYGKVNLCTDAIITLLTLTRAHIHANRCVDLPNTIIQFLCALYSNTPEFQCVFTSLDILTSLSLTVIPVECITDDVFEDEEVVNTDVRTYVIDSPAKKIVLDFIRIIIIDWMNSQGANQKPNQNIVVDTVLEAANTCVCDDAAVVVTDFNTRLLGTLLDHLISTDMDRVLTYLNAVAGLMSRLVDKIWLETFERDPIVVMDFLVGVVNAARNRRSVPPATIDSIYNSLNRTILYVLSRKTNSSDPVTPGTPTTSCTTSSTSSLSSGWILVEVLKKLRSIRTTVFSPHNHAQEFFGCLTYVLLQLESNSPIQLDTNTHTRWHVPLETPKSHVHVEVSTAASRVWEDVYVSKKPIIEELFKVTYSSPDPPPLHSVRDALLDNATKYWVTYITSELSSKKSSVSMHATWEIHTQLQSKIQKVTGGLRSFARSSIRKELSIDKDLSIAGTPSSSESPRQFKRNLMDNWTDAKRLQSLTWKIVTIIKENRRVQSRMRDNELIHLKRYVCDSLLPRLEREVTRERGVWGPEHTSTLDKWMLDTTEGPCRMRKKFIRNEMFYVHYPYKHASRPASTSSLTSPNKSSVRSKSNAPVSRDSAEYSKINPPVSLFDYDYTIDCEVECGVNRSPVTSTSNLQDAIPDESVDVEEPATENQETHSTVLFRLIETPNEKITQIFRVAVIQGLDSVEGLLLFGITHFYLINGFTILTKTREIKETRYLGPGSYEPILPPQCYGSIPIQRGHECFKLPYEHVREVLKRRYLLQPIALEIFCSDGRNYLLAFPRKIRNVVFAKFSNSSKNSEHSDSRQSVAGQKRGTSVEGAGLFSNLIGETSVTQRWVRGEISNFQYLMHLNTLAGRSYNDLMQYPVFPWILSNYDSAYLDLNDPKNFRDLSKPMGAQTPGRLVQFVKRYKEWDDPQGETPPYHYGTHYSSAMIVCSYLVRMESFTQSFLRLQGGHFDLADRMFHSIKEAWTSASRHNMADVKELIPEFFYLPEFLKNGNNFDLGNKQNGTPLNDVILPPWAKNDAREFIRVHRMALESEYVSSRLHEWIDLIFGYKQQGTPAIEAVNVFHHLFYEGNVDIYNIDDPLKKNATIGFINNFGQIPKQLFKRPHPQKKFTKSYGLLDALGERANEHNKNGNVIQSVGVLVSGSVVGNLVGGGGENKIERLFYHAIDCLRPTTTPVRELKGPVGQILPLDNNKATSMLAVEQNKHLMNTRSYVSWGFADCSLRVCHVDTDRPTVICELTQNNDWNGEVVACAVAGENRIITGQTNSVISVWELTSTTPTTSSSSSSSCSSSNTQNSSNLLGYSHPCVTLKQNLHGHSDSITCISCSTAYNILVSGSKDKSVIIWDLARLTFTRQLRAHDNAIDSVAINECSGDIATADGSILRLWDINGFPIATVDTAKSCSIQSTVLCITFSVFNDWDEANVIITGSSDGITRFWSIGFTQTRVNAISESSDSSEDEEGDSKAVDPDKDVDETTVTREHGLGNRNSGCFVPDNLSNLRRESLRGSRSEGNLNTESFEILDESEINQKFSLAPGFVWKRELICRGKLTMHTSYARKDNPEPASITSIAVAKDHKSLFVGDSRGRIYNWSVGDWSSGTGVRDHWVRDESTHQCSGCSLKFSVTERKHHCRNCGQVFCGKCSRFESEIFRLKILKPVRVCQPCFTTLKGRVNLSSTE